MQQILQGFSSILLAFQRFPIISMYIQFRKKTEWARGGDDGAGQKIPNFQHSISDGQQPVR
jgi:hypothetical protein